MKGLAGLLVLSLAAGPVCAGEIKTSVGIRDDAGQTQEVGVKADELRDAVATPMYGDEDVAALAHDFFGKIPGTVIKVEKKFRGWDFEPAPEQTETSVASLVETADKRLTYYNKTVPAPELLEAQGYARTMNSARKMDFDRSGEMGASQMGVYEYFSTKMALGVIKLNTFLKAVAAEAGDAFAYATVAHEAGHTRDHQRGKLSPKAVIDGEVAAFKTQYQWLSVIDPYGERLAFLRTKLMAEQEILPSAMRGRVLAYMNHLADVAETGGDEKKLRELVLKLGYGEGDHNHSPDDGHDHGPSTPTRS